jgi:two-component system response regulator VanR
MEKIVVVDDEKEIADLIALYLKNSGYNVITFYNPLEARDYMTKNPPDLAVLDIMMPELDGLELLKEIRETHYYPIILLTAKDQELDIITGLTLGSDEYITKPFKLLELVARTNALLRRSKVYEKMNDEQDFIYKDLVIDYNNRECFINDEKLQLTNTEYKILEILLKNCGQKVSSEDLFFKVTGESYYNKACNSIATHIRNIRIKLGDSFDNPKYIKTIWGEGYIIEREN